LPTPARTNVSEIGAGHVADREIGKGEAYRIMTGAPIPINADAVVMLEQTVQTPDAFTLRKPFTSGENISLQGEDTKSEHRASILEHFR